MDTIDERLAKLLHKRDQERERKRIQEQERIQERERKRIQERAHVTIDGRTMTLWEAARAFGTTTVYASRIKRGWPPVEAVSRPATWKHYRTIAAECS
jgi:hypothetical protein